MAGRTAGVAFAIAAGIAGTVVIVLPRAVMAAEECLTEPTGEKSDAQRWYYRFDRGTNRRCWYLKDGNGNVRDAAVPARTTQQAAPWDFAPPAPPKLTPRRADGPVARTSADALAEVPQPRLRTDLAVRGTPKPQNVAITPTTLTASDASLSRSLDASPWPSAPPQAEPVANDVSPAAMADAPNNDPDANAAPAADGPAMASKSSKPEAPIHVLMLVVIGALAISGLLASALYRLSRMGRRRRRNGSWHGDPVRTRGGRAKPRTQAPQTVMRTGRGNLAAAPSHSSGSRGSQSASALDLASARLSASTPDHAEPRAYRSAQPQHQDHPAVAARRRERDAAAEMQRSQSTEAVWQAADQLADRAVARRAAPPGPAEQMVTAGAEPSAAVPISTASVAPPTPSAQAQMAAAQMAAAQAAAAKIAAAKIAAAKIASAKASAAAAAAMPQVSSTYAAPAEPWPAVQRAAAPGAAFVPAQPPSAASQPSAAPPPPAQDGPAAPVEVSEIVSALRKARSGDPASAGAAPLDAAKVIAALLVSRAAKRRASQPAGAANDGAQTTAVAAEAAPPRAAAATSSQTMQAPQHLMDRLRNGQQAASVMSDQHAVAREPTAMSGDPAAALIETLRAHAARQPAYQADEYSAAAERAAVADASPGADDDDPAAALFNLLQSRFSLPEDELEAEAHQDEAEEFAPEPQQDVARLQDPTAQLMSLLESQSAIPAAPPAMQAPRQPQQQAPRQPPQQRRPLFVPTPIDDPAAPPLDFIPRPQALRPRASSIQQDESLDGIQDILARLGRRA